MPCQAGPLGQSLQAAAPPSPPHAGQPAHWPQWCSTYRLAIEWQLEAAPTLTYRYSTDAVIQASCPNYPRKVTAGLRNSGLPAACIHELCCLLMNCLFWVRAHLVGGGPQQGVGHLRREASHHVAHRVGGDDGADAQSGSQQARECALPRTTGARQ